MPTLIDWNALQHKLKSYIRQYESCTSMSRALGCIVLDYVLDLTPEEIEDAITDGPRDRGIDAVFVDERSGSNVVHLFQFKYVGTFAKAKNNFPSQEIDKMLSFCSEVLDQNQDLQHSCNPILWGKVQEIWAALERPSPTFEVHFCGNMQELPPTEKTRAEMALEKYKSFTVRHHTLDSIVSLFLQRKEPKLDAEVRAVDKNYFERTDGNIRGLIATIEAMELIKLIQDPDDHKNIRLAVFNDNVRVYLTRKNRINRKIIASALSDTNSEFWYLNNGITMTCESFSYQPQKRAPRISLKNVQIVNGGQTSHALFEAFQESPEKLQNVLVLARIYETRSHDISGQIAESTNCQTPINTRDLRSNDEIQKKLEESFRDQGFYYERKKRQHSEQSKRKRIDALAAGQAYLAYHLSFPEVAKKDRSRIFSDLYDEIFNEDITTHKLLVPLKVFSEIESLKRAIQKNIRKGESFDPHHLFLIDGAYHTLFAVAEICEAKNVNKFDEKQAVSLIPKAVKLIADIVQKEMSADKAFSPSRFFKDGKTKLKVHVAAQECASTLQKIKRTPRKRDRIPKSEIS